MTKKNTPLSVNSSKPKASTGSSGGKSAIQVHTISKDTQPLNDKLLSMLFGINLATGHILKAQEVLLDKIESTAAKVEALRKEVSSLRKEDAPPPGTSSQLPSWLPSNMELQEWLNMPIPSPERIYSPDITCSETPFQSNLLSNAQPYEYYGYGDYQALANPEEPTKK